MFFFSECICSEVFDVDELIQKLELFCKDTFQSQQLEE